MQAGSPETTGAKGAVAGLRRRLRALLGSGDTATARRFASISYLFRVANAGIAFLTQILLAHWMGQYEFGVYAYVWTWVILLGTVTNFGIASSPQRFIPTYAEAGDLDRLRGFLFGSRLITFALATATCIAGTIAFVALRDHVSDWLLIPAILGLACLPLLTVQAVQEGIARTYDWPYAAMAPSYMVRPLLMLALFALFEVFGFPADAVTAMAAALVAVWITSLAQMWQLHRRLGARIPAGPRRMEPRVWLAVSLPQFLVEGFYLLLTYCDIIVLERFVTPGEVAIYYAATKLVSLVAFVSFAVSAASAHKFTQYHVAGRGEDLSAFLRASIRWTFLPSLAMSIVVVALGSPLLSLFGPGFTEGYALIPALVVGLLARASIGPVERLLTMLGQQWICAAVYMVAFLVNIALCLVLVPRLGLMGAAISTSGAFVLETILLFLATRSRLGLHAFYWGGR